MEIRDALGGMAGFALSLLLLVAVGAVFWLLLQGSLWLSVTILPTLWTISLILLGLLVVVALPMAFVPRTRAIAGTAFAGSSWVFGAALWLWGFLLSYAAWGWAGVIIGLVFLGIGVVPVALLAMVLAGSWSYVLQIVVLAILTFGARFFGFYLLGSSPAEPEEIGST